MDEKYSIGGLKYRAYVVMVMGDKQVVWPVHSRDAAGKVQIRILSETESLNIGNAATEDSGSNIY